MAEDSNNNNGPRISYQVKDVVIRLEAKVDAILQAVASKVDLNAFADLVRRVNAVENADTPLLRSRFAEVDAVKERLSALERGETIREAKWSFAQKMWATVVTITAVITPVVVALIVTAHK